MQYSLKKTDTVRKKTIKIVKYKIYNKKKIIVALESFIWVNYEVLWTGQMNLLSYSIVPILHHMFHTVFSPNSKLSFTTISFLFVRTVQINTELYNEKGCKASITR